MAEFLNLNLVHSLEVLLEEGSFARAASRLYITPPAMTQQIQRLEAAVGFPIVERGAKPVRLTARGRRFMEHASLSLLYARMALSEAQTTELRIGFISGYPTGTDDAFLRACRAQLPDATIRLVQVGWSEQIGRLAAGELDASLARPPHGRMDGIDLVPVLIEPRVVGVPADSELAGFDELRLEQLDGWPVVGGLGVSREWTRSWVVDPRPSGVPVAYGSWATTIEEGLSFVAFEGHVLITAASLADRYRYEGVVFRPIVDAPRCRVDLCTRAADTRPVVLGLREVARSLDVGMD